MSHANTSRSLLGALILAAWSGCNCGGPVGAEDGGLEVGDDGGTAMGQGDGGAEVVVDAGLPDAGPFDAGFDAGLADAGLDAGVFDAGLPEVDAGVADAGLFEPDAGFFTCSSCHGSMANAAPPQDTMGNTARSTRTVGAHQKHLGASTWRRTLLCEDCHRVPTAVGDPGHIDPSPAELTFGAVANAGNVASDFNGATCTTYCHGQTLGGGTTRQPDWTTGRSVTCYQCHGLPPPLPHPQNGQCETCHLDVFTEPERHINGTLDVRTDCKSCHGDATSAAPPQDTAGNTATTARTVGAHRSHLGPSTWHAEVPCATCHTVPTTVGDVGHIDLAPAEVLFTGVANAGAVTSSFNGTSCGTYCHGQTLASGTNKTPSWTTVDGTQAACGTCHGNPPALPHPQNAQCATCHIDITAQPQKHIDGVLDVSTTCSSCHGDALSSAPPKDTAGNSATTARTVGAHRAHLGPSAWHSEIQCVTCHVVPTTTGQAGHIDPAPAELTFTGVANAGAVTSSFNGTTCGTYCHGQTLPSGSNKTPSWTMVNGTQAACGTCHGNPPPAPHPQNAQCATCHLDITLTPQRHIDGVLDVKTGCSSCHGDVTSSAPPRDTSGNTVTTAVGVGAHRQHLATSTWRAPMQCASCHVVPVTGDLAHVDTTPAELTFDAVANAANVNSTFDGVSCATYCHGQTLGGGTNATPTWTAVDGGQASCGSCHGLPPPLPHPQKANCATCHYDVTAQPQRHVDGQLQVSLTCTSCHGDATSAAPPSDTAGNTATTVRTVGAHRSHLQASNWRAPVLCTDCHTVPGAVSDPGHLDTSPAELNFGPIASAHGAAPSWSGATCSNYCHGQTLDGGSNVLPRWTVVDGGEAACGTCHGNPPPAPHPQNPVCTNCHLDIHVQPQKHIDGVLDLAVGCNSCHGDATSSAPPKDTQGNTATSARTVGAHRSHLGVSGWHAEVTCDDCHVVPTLRDDPGHIDPSPAEVHYGSTAQSRGALPTWNGTSCANYCHGQTMDGGTNRVPSWTTVNGTQAQCGTCHGLPPPAPHPQNAQCSSCHGAVVNAARAFVDPNLHINGTVEAQVTCGSCHAVPPATGTHALHVGANGTPTYGSLSTAASVNSTTGYAFGCGNCHPMDPAKHMNGGRAEIELYNPTAPPGSLKLRSPLAVYTPGATLFTDDGGIQYTKGTCSSVYCHSGPSYSTPGAVPQPGVDFSFAGYPITYPTFALDVGRAYQPVTWGGVGTGCGACHGLPLRTADPAVKAGVGQSHSSLGASGLESGHAFNHNDSPLPCRTCHYQTVTAANATGRTGGLSTYGPVPIVGWAQHVNGRPDVVFDAVDAVSSAGKPQSLGTASYNQATKTCTSVSCHKSQTAVVNGHPFRPDHVSLECNACHQY